MVCHLEGLAMLLSYVVALIHDETLSYLYSIERYACRAESDLEASARTPYACAHILRTGENTI